MCVWQVLGKEENGASHAGWVNTQIVMINYLDWKAFRLFRWVARTGFTEMTSHPNSQPGKLSTLRANSSNSAHDHCTLILWTCRDGWNEMWYLFMPGKGLDTCPCQQHSSRNMGEGWECLYPLLLDQEHNNSLQGKRSKYSARKFMNPIWRLITLEFLNFWNLRYSFACMGKILFDH